MEGQAQVRLVYEGEVLDGHSPTDVQRMFGEMFKLQGERLAAIFSGERTVLKRGLGPEDAERYLARLRKIGMKVIVEPMESAASAPAAPQAPTPPASAAPALPQATPVNPVNPVTAPTTPTTPVGAEASPTSPLLSMPLTAPRLVPSEDEVVCPNCGERQPKKFVLCRQCTTDIPRALAARQEESDRLRAERLAARQSAGGGGRYAPPRAEVGEVAEHVDGEVDPPKLLSFSFEGRLGRTSFWNAGGLVILGAVLLGIIAAVLVPAMGWLAFIPFFAVLAVGIVWLVRLNVLRLHDFNRSGWWVLLTFVPYVGQLLNIALIVWPGHREENDYGPKPRRGNTVIAAVLLAVYLIAIIAALSFGDKATRRYGERAREAQRAEAQREAAQEREEARLETPSLPPGPAAEAFREGYANAANEKAFAMSSAGAWGWSGGKGSTREAISAALSDCETRREAYTGQCRIVNINGMTPRQR